MTAKRFIVPFKYSLSHSKIQCDGTPLTNDELVRILNTNDGAFLENFNLQKENKELQQFKEKVFSLIDDKIIFVNACEENSRIPKEDYYRGALEVLELLKKELKSE